MFLKQKDVTDNSGFEEWKIFDSFSFFPGDEQGIQKFIQNLGCSNTAINKQVCRIFLSLGHQEDTHSPVNSVIYENTWYNSVKNIISSKTWHFIYLFDISC